MSAPAALAENGTQQWGPMLELAVREVFELMLGSPVSVADSALDAKLDVTSIVGLAGKLSGVLSVHSDDRGATLMAARMLRITPEQVGAHKADALGEICNMVAGNFKIKIPGLGDGCLLSPPTVITGNNYQLYSVRAAPALRRGLMFEGSPVVVALRVDR